MGGEATLTDQNGERRNGTFRRSQRARSRFSEIATGSDHSRMEKGRVVGVERCQILPTHQAFRRPDVGKRHHRRVSSANNKERFNNQKPIS